MSVRSSRWLTVVQESRPFSAAKVRIVAHFSFAKNRLDRYDGRHRNAAEVVVHLQPLLAKHALCRARLVDPKDSACHI
jgi:hypothetical protein